MIRTNFLHLGLSTGSTRSDGHRKFSRDFPGASQSFDTRRGRERDCAPAALDWALLGGPFTSP